MNQFSDPLLVIHSQWNARASSKLSLEKCNGTIEKQIPLWQWETFLTNLHEVHITSFYIKLKAEWDQTVLLYLVKFNVYSWLYIYTYKKNLSL